MPHGTLYVVITQWFCVLPGMVQVTITLEKVPAAPHLIHQKNRESKNVNIKLRKNMYPLEENNPILPEPWFPSLKLNTLIYGGGREREKKSGIIPKSSRIRYI